MVSVIILAAGSSNRMKGVNKQLEQIGGVPVFVMSGLKFQHSEKVGEIIISAPKGCSEEYRAVAEKYGITKLSAVTEGGDTRFLSMKKALSEVSEKADFIAIHDGARPLIGTAEIEKVFSDAETYGAAIAAVPATDTVKVSDGNGFVENTPKRSRLYYAQTPQVFRRELLFDCIERAENRAEEFTDDSSILELCGEKVKLTEIDCCNMKITRKEDLTAARAIFESEGNYENRIRL